MLHRRDRHAPAPSAFDAEVNPSGILFNPESIADTITDALDDRRFTAGELFEVDGTWRTLRRHSRFSLPDRDATLRLLNSSLDATRSRLLSADLLIVTFGSAIVHRHIPSAAWQPTATSSRHRFFG